MPTAEAQADGNLYDLLENIAQFYERQLQQSSAQQYFKQRGLTAETIAYWRLGYAPEDWQHLEKAFPQDIEGLKLLGLIRTSDSGRDLTCSVIVSSFRFVIVKAAWLVSVVVR